MVIFQPAELLICAYSTNARQLMSFKVCSKVYSIVILRPTPKAYWRPMFTGWNAPRSVDRLPFRAWYFTTLAGPLVGSRMSWIPLRRHCRPFSEPIGRKCDPKVLSWDAKRHFRKVSRGRHQLLQGKVRNFRIVAALQLLLVMTKSPLVGQNMSAFLSWPLTLLKQIRNLFQV